MDTEKVHRYPRPLTWAVEILAALGVTLALLLLGRDLLRYLWDAFGVDAALFARLTFLPDLVQTINDAPLDTTPLRLAWDRIAALDSLLPALGWTALALLLALLLRNSLPTLRTSPRGMLVEFAGDWLPVPWENFRAIKVTESSERFVLLAETGGGTLTGWHRCYSLIYRLGFRPGFLITSAISEFDALAKTLLSETDRVARALDTARPPKLDEEAASPLFRLLLSPGAFFAQRTGSAPAPAEVNAVAGGSETVVGTYPARISAVLTWGTGAVAALALLHYLTQLATFLALTFRDLRQLPIFSALELRELPAPWWLLVAAHLGLILVLWLLLAIRNLLPALEARRDGLALHYLGRTEVVPWQRITAVKVTELSEQSQVVLFQFSGGLPLVARLASLVYDGSLAPGVLATSAMRNFEPLLQRVILEVMRHPADQSAPDAPVFQSDARSDLLMLSLSSSQGIDKLVEEARADGRTASAAPGALLRTGAPMAALALLPALILVAERVLVLGVLPDVTLLVAAAVLFLMTLLEWPLTSIASVVLDEMSGGGEEGQRATYLYPIVQLPRVLPLFAALLLTLVGLPILPQLLWLAAIGWSFLLAAGLWGALYDWRGGQLLTGGLIPVVYQLLILVGYLSVRG